MHFQSQGLMSQRRDEELTHGVQTTHSGVIPILESQPPGPNYVECDDIHNIISYNISMII